MKTVSTFGFFLAAGVLGTASVAAGQAFSGLYVFGDSLSDVGNVNLASLGTLPGPGYDPQRFSNGILWTEYLADELAVARPTFSLGGGGSYAFGGATTGAGFGFPLIPRIGTQVNQYTAAGVDAGGLHVLWAGANDVIDSEASFNATTYGANVLGHLNTLYAAGARSFLVNNVPDLGLLPRYDGNPTLAAAATTATGNLNAALAGVLDTFEAANPDATLFRLDVAGLFDDLVADPSAFGLVNVTDPAFDDATNTPLTTMPETYLFWDETHPTTAAHRLLALEAAAVIPEPAGLTLLACGLGMATRRRRAA
ncbi:MAG: SGNH/GDSL hydrolase family protein [Phycisphaerae bacterium]